MKEQDEKKLVALQYLADVLGIDLEGSNIAVTKNGWAKAKNTDGSLEATIYERDERIPPMVEVESPGRPGVDIRLVDHLKDYSAPEGAVYRIGAYIPQEKYKETLNGDVRYIYVGREGIMFSDVALERAAKLHAAGVGEQRKRKHLFWS